MARPATKLALAALLATLLAAPWAAAARSIQAEAGALARGGDGGAAADGAGRALQSEAPTTPPPGKLAVGLGCSLLLTRAGELLLERRSSRG